MLSVINKIMKDLAPATVLKFTLKEQTEHVNTGYFNVPIFTFHFRSYFISLFSMKQEIFIITHIFMNYNLYLHYYFPVLILVFKFLMLLK